MTTDSRSLLRSLRWLPLVVGIAAVTVYIAMIDLKGISTDEGVRLGIINGGRQFTPVVSQPEPTYSEVLQTVSSFAYQPAYYLLQNTIMRALGRHELLVFRLVNVVFLGVCLWGLFSSTRDWAPLAQTFFVGLFAFNAYLFMHVLQIREYIVAVAFYIWSTRLVLYLDRKRLEQEWIDALGFLLYGLLLALGFYVQTWCVFPAIAQGFFLIFRRRSQLLRFLSHLALSYLVVITLVWPYLRANTQKVNIGLWATENVTLGQQLGQGFNLVLAGQPAGHDRFTSALPFAWLALVTCGIVAAWTWRHRLPSGFVRDTGREAWLLLLSSGVPLAFQIAYFYKVEPLSVWPRYFVVHYFSLSALVAQAFRVLMVTSTYNLGVRLCRPVLVAAGLLLIVSSIVQVRSFWHDPYFDTSTTAASNWPAIGAAFQNALHTDDIVFTHDFVTRSTLTATLPMSNRALMLQDLEKSALSQAPRLLYLESKLTAPERPDLIRRMAALGFTRISESPVPAGDGSGALTEWCILTFSRR